MINYTSVSPSEFLPPLHDDRGLPLSGDGHAFLGRGAHYKVSPSVSLAEYVGAKFIPEHIAQMSFAGRRHYQSMLKHILRPETVNQLFSPGLEKAKPRLKAIPGWPYLDDVRLCELRVDHVRNLTGAALARGYSTQTVKHIRNVLGVIVTHAKRERLFTDENPVSGVELPPICRKQPQNLTIAQAKAMLKIMQYPEREIALMAITTGMSIQEICGLQWKHVNLTKTTIDCDEKTIPPGCILLRQHWNPEGISELHPSRVRLIEVPQPLLLRLLRVRQEATSPTPGSFVLANPSGAPIRPDSLRMIRLKAIGRRISIPWLSWRIVKRAHDAMLSELRNQLNTELVSSAP